MAFVLKRNMRGSEVKKLQERLIELGFLAENASDQTKNDDGIFGGITEDAVKDFQKDKGLIIDGLVGPQTAASLGLIPPSPAFLPKAKEKNILNEAQLRKLAEIIDGLIPTGMFDIFDDDAISWAVERIDSIIADLLPPKILQYINDLSKGIDSKDLSEIKLRLAEDINKNIDIPLLSNAIEGRIILFVLDLLCEALQIGRNFDNALAYAAKKTFSR